MSNQLTLDQRKKRIETIVKVLGLAGLCLILGPVYITLLHGMAALVALGVASLIGFTVVNFLPAFAALIANWRLKALKAVAAQNPIETLENQYAQRQDALLKIRDNIKEFHAVVAELWTQIQDHNQKYPNHPSQFVEKYTKMKALLALRSQKYKQAQSNLVAFGELLEEKRSDWKVAQSAAKAMKLANVGEDFTSKLMSDTALSTIQDGLNMAFSELEVSLLDEQPITAVPSAIAQSKIIVQLPEKAGPPPLDLPDIEVEAVPVAAAGRRSK